MSEGLDAFVSIPGDSVAMHPVIHRAKGYECVVAHPGSGEQHKDANKEQGKDKSMCSPIHTEYEPESYLNLSGFQSLRGAVTEVRGIIFNIL